MLERLTIQSHEGPYTVSFTDEPLRDPGSLLEGDAHVLLDAKVARLYGSRLGPVVSHSKTILVEATEENKSIDRLIPVMERLVGQQIRRGHTLVAIGGGIVQDIAAFISTVLLRGLRWRFVPTTLLAQADSCIGSKSSINLRDTKNILGTFHPPAEILLCSEFLDTLQERDIRSGIGEILKVHAIDSPGAYDRVAASYDHLASDRQVLLSYVRSALLIKQRYIEIDEFDRGVRNVFNYGHSFGHAIESATDFTVPHGIGVTIGMDVANHLAVARDLLPEHHARRMRPPLQKNYASFAHTKIPLDRFFSALLKDKKNTTTQLVLIFPVGDDARIERVEVIPDDAFRQQCAALLDGLAA